MEVPLIHLSSRIYVLTAPWRILIPVTGGNDHFFPAPQTGENNTLSHHSLPGRQHNMFAQSKLWVAEAGQVLISWLSVITQVLL